MGKQWRALDEKSRANFTALAKQGKSATHSRKLHLKSLNIFNRKFEWILLPKLIEILPYLISWINYPAREMKKFSKELKVTPAVMKKLTKKKRLRQKNQINGYILFQREYRRETISKIKVNLWIPINGVH